MMKVMINECENGKTKYITMANEICLNLKHYKENKFKENEFVYVKTNKYNYMGMITFCNRDSEKKIFFSKSIYSKLDKNDYIYIKSINRIEMKNYSVSSISVLKNKNITICENIYNNIFYSDKVNEVMIVNNCNGYVFKIDKKYVVVDENRGSNEIKISKKYRALLELELPTYIVQSYLNELNKNNNIEKLYKCERENVKTEDYYNASLLFKNSINNSSCNLISLYPIESKKKRIKLRDINEWILSKFIGQTELDLRAIRPQDIDESENIVRLSESSMKLLGIEETDTIDIYSGNKLITARVLKFDGFNIISKENRLKNDNDLNLSIGIPAYLRRELELPYINYNVIVKRNLKYFFRKHLNNQMITIIGFIVSLSVIEKISNKYYRGVVIILVLIIMIYISFSGIREKISNR